MTCCSRTKEIIELENIDQALRIFCAAHYFTILNNNDLNLEEYYDYYCRDCEKCRTNIRDFIDKKLTNIDTIMEYIDNKEEVRCEELPTLFKEDISILIYNMVLITNIYKGRIRDLYKDYTFMQYVSECFSLKLCKCSRGFDSRSLFCSFACLEVDIDPNDKELITKILETYQFV